MQIGCCIGSRDFADEDHPHRNGASRDWRSDQARKSFCVSPQQEAHFTQAVSVYSKSNTNQEERLPNAQKSLRVPDSRATVAQTWGEDDNGTAYAITFLRYRSSRPKPTIDTGGEFPLEVDWGGIWVGWDHRRRGKPWPPTTQRATGKPSSSSEVSHGKSIH